MVFLTCTDLPISFTSNLSPSKRPTWLLLVTETTAPCLSTTAILVDLQHTKAEDWHSIIVFTVNKIMLGNLYTLELVYVGSSSHVNNLVVAILLPGTILQNLTPLNCLNHIMWHNKVRQWDETILHCTLGDSYLVVDNSSTLSNTIIAAFVLFQEVVQSMKVKLFLGRQGTPEFLLWWRFSYTTYSMHSLASNNKVQKLTPCRNCHIYSHLTLSAYMQR